jgi:hypothetical protein
MPAFTRRQYSGAAAATTITAAINPTDTTCSLAATTGWPSTGSVPFYIVLDPGTSSEEKCSATISGTTLTLTRGQDDTSGSSHSAGATVYPVFTANDADEANELVAKLTTKGDLLVTTGSALNRLAVGTNDFALLADSGAANGVAWKQIPAAGLASDSVTTAKILNANVTEAKLADNAVTQAKMADRAVGSAELDNLTLNPITDTYTLVLADAHKLVTCDKATGFTVTIPPNSSVEFIIGDQVNLMQIGDGQVTVAAGAGVTLEAQGSKKKLNGKWATATAVKIATNTWVLIGNTAA